MSDYEASVAVDAVIEALGAVTRLFMRGGEVVRGQENRVPLPNTPSCVLTDVLTVDLGRPVLNYLPDTDQALIQGGARIDVQMDFYGQSATDIAKSFCKAFRSAWAPDQFPVNIKPLYCTDAVNAPLVTGEQQYENRFMVTATLQYNPVVTVPQQFADAAKLQTNEIVAADLLPE